VKGNDAESERPTVSLPFDTSAYARILEERICDGHLGSNADTPPTPAVATAVRSDAEEAVTVTAILPPVRLQGTADDATIDLDDPETVGREMYGCYLASDFPSALVLAERVLGCAPDHALAKLVADRCRERLYPNRRTLSPSSVLRLKAGELARHAGRIDAASSVVLGHVDGVSTASTVVALTGLPAPEALNRLNALLDLGVLEVVNA
jgi:hypothetical protein